MPYPSSNSAKPDEAGGREGAKAGETISPPRLPASPPAAPTIELDPRQAPTSLEMGPAGQPFGVATSADFDAKPAVPRAGGGEARRRERDRPSRLRAAPPPRLPSLLHDEAFRSFWIARLLTQTGQGALVYALLIVVVDKTDASFFNSLFVVCALLPSVIFGLPAGVVVDALPRRPLLVVLNLLRFGFALALVSKEPSLPGIFAAALGIWTIHQFHSPTESAVLATLVPRDRYTSAQALSNLALTLAQLMGLVILAPILLKTAGPQTLFALCAALFVLAALVAALLPPLNEHLRWPGIARRPASSREALLVGWRTARRDHVMYEVLTDDVLVGIGASALIVIVPLYLKGVLNTGAENTVFVFAPAALGLVIGLRLSPRIGHLVGERRSATASLIVFSICVAMLGFVEQIRNVLIHDVRFPLDRIAAAVHIPELVLIVMLLSVPAGFASSVVSVSSRSVLLARTPPAARGQVIATQSLLQNLGALVPTLLAGIAADLFGVERVAVAIALLIAFGALAALTIYRPVPVVSPSS